MSELELAHLGLISALLYRFKKTEPTLYEQVKVKPRALSPNKVDKTPYA